MAERIAGTVVWFDRVRGYGFLAPDERGEIPALAEGKDLFVHFSQIENQAQRKILFEGQRVEFAVIPDDNRGLMAGAVLALTERM